MARYKRFFVVASGLLVIGLVLLAGSIVVRQHIPDDYIGAERAYLTGLNTYLVDFDSIARGQRIALVGSSPILMGLSAEQIETATGVPSRNLSLDSSRSVFDDYVSMVEEHIRPGDVVIIADPNLRRSPQLKLPLRCVTHFEFDCMRPQSGFRPRIVQDALVLFTGRAFGEEPLPQTARGDFIFPKVPQYAPFRARFAGPFPNNGVANIAQLAADIRRHGACPIFLLTPLLPEPEALSLWQNEVDKLWRHIDEAGLHDIVVQDSPLWTDRTLFHHDEHMSERGREVWTRMVVAKLQENGLPGSCRHDVARTN
jgi:hypothetical protein